MKSKVRLIRSLLGRYPWIPGVLTLLYVLFALLVVAVIVYFPSVADSARFFKFVSNVLIAGPIVVTVLQILNLRHTVTSIPRLAFLYLEIILMYAVVYFYAVLDSGTDSVPVIRGIDAEWVQMITLDKNADKSETLRAAIVSFEDCVYFSMVTSTTVGYGDMIPVSPVTKLLVGSQVLTSFFLIAFGAGYFFSVSSRGASQSEMEEIKAQLKRIEERVCHPGDSEEK